jgi:hypothetical protein
MDNTKTQPQPAPDAVAERDEINERLYGQLPGTQRTQREIAASRERDERTYDLTGLD